MTTKRRGHPERRRAEFAAIVQQIKKNKPRFIRRLQGLIRADGDCLRFLGSHTKDGYGRMNVTYRSERGTRHIQIYAHRLFLILGLCRPIKMDHDAGHQELCRHRDCVLHVFEQHYAANCNTNGTQVPF